MLSEKFQKIFEQCQQKNITRKLLLFIVNDITKERNKNSNPSLFIKFIAINNLRLLPDTDLENLLLVSLDRLNVYISCDKNLLNLLYTVLRKSQEKLKKKVKQRMFEQVVESFFLYFSELQNPSQAKDKEILKNFISHYKLFLEFSGKKHFKTLSRNLLEIIIQISLASYFIDSAFQAQIFSQVFKQLDQFPQFAKTRTNSFYYDQAKHPKGGEPDSQPKDVSSFSDYKNCVPQKEMEEEILIKLYELVSEFLRSLLKQVPRAFFNIHIWQRVIGEDFYYQRIIRFFKESLFIESKNGLERFPSQLALRFFQKETANEAEAHWEHLQVFDQALLNQFYYKHVRTFSLGEPSLVLMFHLTKRSVLKFELLDVFQSLLKILPAQFLQ